MFSKIEGQIGQDKTQKFFRPLHEGDRDERDTFANWSSSNRETGTRVKQIIVN